MKKLTLRLDTLAVESFEAAAEVRDEGTVQGHWAPSDNRPRTFCCPKTYEPSCGDTCTCI